jgi:D-amino-acid dehydrogenase
MVPGRRTDYDAVVVGGGVIGLCTAYYLARLGAATVLLERKEVGAGASSGNAGAVAPGHGPMTRPGRILQAMKWMLDPTSPLYVPPRWNPGLWQWLWRFNRYCRESHVRRSMDILGPLGHLGRDLFDQLVAEESLDCAYETKGYYDVFRTKAGFEGAQTEIPLQAHHGYATEAVPGDTLEEREPSLLPGTVGGLFFPEAATLDPGRFMTGLAHAAEGRGLEIRTGASVSNLMKEGSRVTGVHLADGPTITASSVVLATGAYSLDLVAEAGYTLPIQPAKGYHRDLPGERAGGDAGVKLPGLTMMLGERYVFCTPMGGFLRLAGTLELSGLNHRIVQPRLENLTESAKQYLRGLEDGKSSDDWVGLRPVTPDGMPVVGAIPGAENVFVANGHAMLGLTLGPVTGRLLAEWITEGRQPDGLRGLEPRRF